MLLFSFVKYYSQCQITASRILIYHNLKTAKIFDLINLQFTPAHTVNGSTPKWQNEGYVTHQRKMKNVQTKSNLTLKARCFIVINIFKEIIRKTFSISKFKELVESDIVNDF